MTPIVVDASVAAKWLLPGTQEPLADEAAELFGRYSKGELRFAVPDLFWVELGGVLWKAVRVGRCSRPIADSALASLADFNFPTIPSKSLLDLAFAIATAFDRSVYDSLYVALAVSMKSHLVTADEKLANALASKFPVKWLGAYL